MLSHPLPTRYVLHIVRLWHRTTQLVTQAAGVRFLDTLLTQFLTARRSTSNVAYVPGGCTFRLLFSCTDDDMDSGSRSTRSTLNDPTTFPGPEVFEKSRTDLTVYSSWDDAGLVSLAAAFVTLDSSTPLFDGLGISLIAHNHVGVRFLHCEFPYYIYSARGIRFDAMLVDYAYKLKFPTLGLLFSRTLPNLRLTSLAVGVGVYQFNSSDIGASL